MCLKSIVFDQRGNGVKLKQGQWQVMMNNNTGDGQGIENRGAYLKDNTRATVLNTVT